MKKIYTDASFRWKRNEDKNPKVGKICIVNGVKEIIEDINSPEIEGYKQYINLFELSAIRRAMEVIEEDEMEINSDSKIAIGWAKKSKNDLDRFSEYHKIIKDDIDKLKEDFDRVEFSWIERGKNPAGVILDEVK